MLGLNDIIPYSMPAGRAMAVKTFAVSGSDGIIITQSDRKGFIAPMNARTYYALVADSLTALAKMSDGEVMAASGAAPSYVSELRKTTLEKLRTQLVLSNSSTELLPGLLKNENGTMIATGRRIVPGGVSKKSKRRRLMEALPIGQFAAYPLGKADIVHRNVKTAGPMTMWASGLPQRQSAEHPFAIIVEDQSYFRSAFSMEAIYCQGASWYEYMDTRHSGIDPYLIGLRRNEQALMVRHSEIVKGQLFSAGNSSISISPDISTAIVHIKDLLERYGGLNLLIPVLSTYNDTYAFDNALNDLAEEYPIALYMWYTPSFSARSGYNRLCDGLITKRYAHYESLGMSDSPITATVSAVFAEFAPIYTGVILPRSTWTRYRLRVETTAKEVADVLGTKMNRLYVRATTNSAPPYLFSRGSDMVITSETIPGTGHFNSILANTAPNRKLPKMAEIIAVEPHSIWPCLLANKGVL